MKLRTSLINMRLEFETAKSNPVTVDECKMFEELVKNNQPLPQNIHRSTDDGVFLKIENHDLSESELNEYLMYKKLKYVRTIKNCIVFFTVLTVLELIGGLILAFSIL